MNDDAFRTVRIWTKIRGRHDIAGERRNRSRLQRFSHESIKANCATSECGYDQIPHPPLFQAGFNLVGSCDVSGFNSLTRRQFVSGSHVGCMSTANLPWYFRLIIRTISNCRQLSRERAPTPMSQYSVFPYFHNLRLKTNPTPTAMNTALVGFC
jgi:hypothetical protein